MKKALILSIVSILFSLSVSAQTADDGFERPLVDVLKDVEQQFGIRIKYDKKMVEGKTLRYADWRIKPWNAEETLRAILSPYNYSFALDMGASAKSNVTTYKVKEFEYPRTVASEGKKFLDYLETLYSNQYEWEARKSEIKPCLHEALRLSPLPVQPQSKVILTKKRKYDGYAVENFAIETLPGIYVCGSIYKPINVKGKSPIVLNPNGHFGQGRYREDQQKRCAMQARMGAISASWDLFAWGESLLQFEGTLHRLSAAHSIQMLNTCRVLDYLLSLKEADNTRVAITGGSGGGSVTMLMAAMDDRITMSIPTVMLSSHFSGGCPCESGMPTHLCGKRTNNAELSAMFAPKPQLVISDGKDWTYTVPELEFPFIQRTYNFYNATANLENAHFPTEGHDYGFSKRNAMYRFMAKHFDLDINKLLDKDGNIDESKITIEKEPMMYTFGEKGEKLPANTIKGKEALLEVLRNVGIEK